MSISCNTVEPKLRATFLGELSHEVGIQVEVAHKLGSVGNRTGLHLVGLDIARKHIVALGILRPRHRSVNVANARNEADVGREIVVRTIEIQVQPTPIHGSQRLRQWNRFGRRRDVKIHQIIVSEAHVLDFQGVIAILKIKRVHTDVAFKGSGVAKLYLDVVDPKMFDGTGKPTLKLHQIRHFVHDVGKHADVGQHHLGWAYGGIKND